MQQRLHCEDKAFRGLVELDPFCVVCSLLSTFTFFGELLRETSDRFTLPIEVPFLEEEEEEEEEEFDFGSRMIFLMTFLFSIFQTPESKALSKFDK